MRFSKPIRRLASVLYTISLLLYIPIVIYVPALVFSQVTGYGIHIITPIFSFVCITYTTMVRFQQFVFFILFENVTFSYWIINTFFLTLDQYYYLKFIIL